MKIEGVDKQSTMPPVASTTRHTHSLTTRSNTGLIARGLADVERCEGEQLFELGRAAYDRGVWTEAIRLFRLAADQGHAGALVELSEMYEEGCGVLKDDVEAARLLRLAADAGHAYAQFSLGMAYSRGWHFPVDNTEAARWLHRSADQGFGEAQFELGMMYASGCGVPQDRAEADRRYRLAAEQGSAQAWWLLQGSTPRRHPG